MTALSFNKTKKLNNLCRSPLQEVIEHYSLESQNMRLNMRHKKLNLEGD